jgi:hypothetical protein
MSETVTDRALEIAAQAWCAPKCRNLTVDPVLASAFADLLAPYLGFFGGAQIFSDCRILLETKNRLTS